MQSVGNVFFLGLGLIGGSLAKAIKKNALADRIVAYSNSEADLDLALESSTIDAKQTDLIKGLQTADLIVLALPTLAMRQYIQTIADHKKAEAIVTDVASVKGAVADMISAELGELPSLWVLGHPIAGSEKSGFMATRETLFENHKVILTPNENTDAAAIAEVTLLWSACGAQVETMAIEMHDQIFAATSHLPHLLAFVLVDTLKGLDIETDIFRFAAGGFRDATRIAGSNPIMWHDIMLTNDTAILSVLEKVQLNITRLSEAIANKDSQLIADCFENAKAAREHFQSLIEN